MRNRELVDRKLDRAEGEAMETLHGYGLPTDPGDLWLDDEPQFRDATGRDKRRMTAARNVLIAAREVRRRRDDGDLEGALRFMSYIEQGADLLDNARRGAGTIKAARQGGVSRAQAERRKMEERDAAVKQRAKGLREAHPAWSVRSIAKQLENEDFGKAETLRQKIADLKPDTK